MLCYRRVCRNIMYENYQGRWGGGVTCSKMALLTPFTISTSPMNPSPLPQILHKLLFSNPLAGNIQSSKSSLEPGSLVGNRAKRIGKKEPGLGLSKRNGKQQFMGKISRAIEAYYGLCKKWRTRIKASIARGDMKGDDFFL